MEGEQHPPTETFRTVAFSFVYSCFSVVLYLHKLTYVICFLFMLVSFLYCIRVTFVLILYFFGFLFYFFKVQQHTTSLPAFVI